MLIVCLIRSRGALCECGSDVAVCVCVCGKCNSGGNNNRKRIETATPSKTIT